MNKVLIEEKGDESMMTKKIDGVKFFQKELDVLRLYAHEYVNTKDTKGLTASALSCYIVFHYHCDDFGRILTSDFCLKHVAEKHNLEYSSLYKGLHRLIEMGLILNHFIEDKEYYSINQYETYNSPERGEKLNYFILPDYLLESEVLRGFIRSRDVNGLIGLLELINALSRENSRRNKQAVIRRAETLMEKMKKCTRNIIGWIQRISKFLNVQEKKGRIRKENQWSFILSDECYNTQVQDIHKQRMGAAIRKEIQSVFTRLRLPAKKKDIHDVYISTLQDILDPMYPIINTFDGERILKFILNDTIARTADALMKQQKNKKIKTIPAFWRKVSRNIIKEHFISLDFDAKAQMQEHAMKNDKDLPAFLF